MILGAANQLATEAKPDMAGSLRIGKPVAITRIRQE
jgi:hypothetical protein